MHAWLRIVSITIIVIPNKRTWRRYYVRRPQKHRNRKCNTYVTSSTEVFISGTITDVETVLISSVYIVFVRTRAVRGIAYRAPQYRIDGDVVKKIPSSWILLRCTDSGASQHCSLVLCVPDDLSAYLRSPATVLYNLPS